MRAWGPVTRLADTRSGAPGWLLCQADRAYARACCCLPHGHPAGSKEQCQLVVHMLKNFKCSLQSAFRGSNHARIAFVCNRGVQPYFHIMQQLHLSPLLLTSLPWRSVQVRTIERVCEIPHEGPFCDLMWSDPEDIDTWAVSPRGAGWLFGARVTQEFNHLNGLDLICRAHQLVQEGLKFMFTGAHLLQCRTCIILFCCCAKF